jgi:nicotinate dehydrogenase subunit A
MPAITLTVNGGARTLDLRDPEKPLLSTLRNDLGLKGTMTETAPKNG